MMTFSYGGHVLLLRNPDFGNNHTIESRRINRKTRGGDLVVYRDPQWPKTEILEYEFSYLDGNQVNGIIEFLTISLGQQVAHTDYEGRNWTGFILTPSEAISEASRNNVGFSLHFQGTQV